jgi:hypothetical protein
MNSQATALRVASLVFALVALGHLLRLLKHAKVLIGTYDVPMGLSWAGLIIAGALCIWMWRVSSVGKM